MCLKVLNGKQMVAWSMALQPARCHNTVSSHILFVFKLNVFCQKVKSVTFLQRGLTTSSGKKNNADNISPCQSVQILVMYTWRSQRSQQ